MSVNAPRSISTYSAAAAGSSIGANVGLIVTTAPEMVTCDEEASIEETMLLSDTFLMTICCPGPGTTFSENVREILLVSSTSVAPSPGTCCTKDGAVVSGVSVEPMVRDAPPLLVSPTATKRPSPKPNPRHCPEPKVSQFVAAENV